MTAVRKYLDIAERVARILGYSRTVPEGALTVDIVINTRAGALSHPRRFKRVYRIFRDFTAGLEGERRPAEGTVVHYHFTQYHGHAREITRRILLSGAGAGRHRVIVSLGGDGTHGEILSVLSKADANVQHRTTVFRLPLGSGNDGADAPDLARALRLMLSARTVRGLPYVRVETAGERTFDAFNIVSVGIDAFVTDVSTRVKRFLPGNVYRIAAAVSAALYQTVLRPREMALELGRPGGAPVPRAGRFVLLAVGPSAPRTYGNGMRILPDEHNVCLVHRLTTLQIMMLKKLMYRGEHVELPMVESFVSNSLVIRYDGRLPLQADGEAVTLEAGEFPLRVYRAWSGVHVPDAGLSAATDSELVASEAQHLGDQSNS